MASRGKPGVDAPDNPGSDTPSSESQSSRQSRPRGQKRPAKRPAPVAGTGEQLRQVWHEVREAADQLQFILEQSIEARAGVRAAGQEFASLVTRSQEVRLEIERDGEELDALRQQLAEAAGQLGQVRRELAESEQRLRAARQEAQAAGEQALETGAAMARAVEVFRAARSEADDAVVGCAARAGEATTAAAERLEELRRLAAEAHREFGQAAARLHAVRDEAHDARQHSERLATEIQSLMHARQAGRPTASRPLTQPPDARPSEANGTASDFVLAAVRDERPADRLARYLSEAARTEEDLTGLYRALARQAIDPDVRARLVALSQAARQQHAALAARLRGMGRRVRFRRGPADDLDRAVQLLWKAFAACQYKAALYQAVAAFATTAEDADTAALAANCLRRERAAAGRLWRLLEPAAVRAAEPFEAS